jgi:diacylglycerol kinase (ATP)
MGNKMNIESYIKNKHHIRVKLIFNPGSGANEKSPLQLMDVIKEMQALRLMPEPFLIEPDCDLQTVIDDAAAQGIRMFVVCGGDGTVSAAVRALLNIDCILGIIPTGTQNNIAYSLGIPFEIKNAVSLLRMGKRTKIDVGMVTCGDQVTPFLEVCSVGLVSSLFPSGDDIQHGKITRVGDFLTTFAASPAADIHLLLDDKNEIQKMGHVVLISNMPYIGRHYQFGPLNSFKDGFLDVIFFPDLSKLDLIGYALKGPGIDKTVDPRIQRFRVRALNIETHPDMSIMADGISVGEGSVHIEIRHRALTVIASMPEQKDISEAGESLEK